MSNEVIEAIRRVIPIGSKRSGRGFIDFNCPVCGDRRGRGGLLETPTGGFRYRCFNGGCTYEEAAGWEPGSAFGGRARRIFLELGGDLSEIPSEMLTGRTRVFLPIPEWIEYMMDEKTALLMRPEHDAIRDFPEVELPIGSVCIWDGTNAPAERARSYVHSRGECFEEYPFIVSPKYPNYVLIPFLHRNRIIGWIGRQLKPTTTRGPLVRNPGSKHLKCPNWPTDFMLNQESVHEYDMVLVVQGAFDAIALKALCTFGNVITSKQANLLNQSGRQIVLVPDYKGTEWRNYWQVAKQHGWKLAVPDWGGNYGPVDYIKDPGEAIQKMGLLATLQKIMDSVTDDYATAENDLIFRSRG